ncbi:MAG TPA: hypothetical protein H9740_12715 [Candidatus Hungatella pullicola]|nr:hypothetical protein [Candidatus Hungatella pullicola]
MSVAGWGFGILFILLIWAVIIGVIALVAYFVIKKAVKDAIRESREEM